jgi:hypothetical protein
MRSLEAAHEELKAVGDLTDIKVMARGQDQHLMYLFRQESEPDPALVQLLREQRISAPRAVQLATEYPQRVEQAVVYAEQLRRQGKPPRNPPGFIADVISNPDKYVLPEQVGEPAAPRPGEHIKRALAHSETEAQQEHDARLAAQVALSPSGRRSVRPCGGGSKKSRPHRTDDPGDTVPE